MCVGVSFWIWGGGVFKRVFKRRLSLFSGLFLASAVENVVYFAFFGVIGEHGFLEGGEKKGTFEYAFCFGFRGFLRFSTSSHETTIFIGFSGGHRFLSENRLWDPYFCSVLAGGDISTDLQYARAIPGRNHYKTSGFAPVTVGAHFPGTKDKKCTKKTNAEKTWGERIVSTLFVCKTPIFVVFLACAAC